MKNLNKSEKFVIHKYNKGFGVWQNVKGWNKYNSLNDFITEKQAIDFIKTLDTSFNFFKKLK